MKTVLDPVLVQSGRVDRQTGRDRGQGHRAGTEDRDSRQGHGAGTEDWDLPHRPPCPALTRKPLWLRGIHSALCLVRFMLKIPQQ